ncbi:MAG: hypothetical protein ACPG8W_26110, partial [Candidatus Promineifilaceae bacterium]
MIRETKILYTSANRNTLNRGAASTEWLVNHDAVVVELANDNVGHVCTWTSHSVHPDTAFLFLGTHAVGK